MSGIDGMEGLEPSDICSICSCEFNEENEGGIKGYIGILPFSFCPTCFNGVMDMFEQLTEDWDDADQVN